MKIGIISDTHGDFATWQQVLANCFLDVNYIIHAGDLLYHGPRNPLVPGYDPAGLAAAMNSCGVPMVVAKGNCDAEVDQLLLDFPIQAPYALVRENGLTIMVNHGDGLDREAMAQMAHRYRVDMFISGHTHEPYLDIQEGVVLLNPGSCALPKGTGIPTIALLDERKVAVINLTTGEEVAALLIS